MRYPKRADANQKPIMEALRKFGAAVTSIHTIGKGVPDLLVSYKGTWFVFEVKNPLVPRSDQKLTQDETDWMGLQKAPVYIVRTPEQAIAVLTVIR